MRIAIIHYWLVNWRGGEKVLKAILDLYPQADLYTHVVNRELVEKEIPGRRIRTTFISRLPFAGRFYQKYLPLMPLALEQLDLRSYDLVISSESGPAKGVVVAPHATHVCYCHSPMRYVWDMYHTYTARLGPVGRIASRVLLHYLRQWDQLSSQRVDFYVANSRFVAKRIEKYYRRSATVVHPPVDVHEFSPGDIKGEHYLYVGQLVQYKRPDLLIEAFNQTNRPLIVVGDGELFNSLRKRANSNIQLLGRRSTAEIRRLYQSCRALLFPGIEDFGIVPLEAMACGKPVLAYASGGALETVIHGKTGILFDDQSANGILRAVAEFERSKELFDPIVIRSHALQFSEERFKTEFRMFVNNAIAEATAQH